MRISRGTSCDRETGTLLPLPAGEGWGEGHLLPLPAGEGWGEGHLLPLPAGEGGGEGHLLPLPAGEGGGEGHPHHTGPEIPPSLRTRQKCTAMRNAATRGMPTQCST